jgi:plasmid maintenance system killer protein
MPIAIGYENKQLEKICTKTKVARKALPQDVADLLLQRLFELSAFASLGDIPSGAPLHFHPLKEDLAGHFAVSVGAKYRIVFVPDGDFELLEDETPDLATVTEIVVTYVGDYHGN